MLEMWLYIGIVFCLATETLQKERRLDSGIHNEMDEPGKESGGAQEPVLITVTRDGKVSVLNGADSRRDDSPKKTIETWSVKKMLDVFGFQKDDDASRTKRDAIIDARNASKLNNNQAHSKVENSTAGRLNVTGTGNETFSVHNDANITESELRSRTKIAGHGSRDKHHGSSGHSTRGPSKNSKGDDKDDSGCGSKCDGSSGCGSKCGGSKQESSGCGSNCGGSKQESSGCGFKCGEDSKESDGKTSSEESEPEIRKPSNCNSGSCGNDKKSSTRHSKDRMMRGGSVVPGVVRTNDTESGRLVISLKQPRADEVDSTRTPNADPTMRNSSDIPAETTPSGPQISIKFILYSNAKEGSTNPPAGSGNTSLIHQRRRTLSPGFSSSESDSDGVGKFARAADSDEAGPSSWRTVKLSKQNREFYADRKWPDGIVRYFISDNHTYDMEAVRRRLAAVSRVLRGHTCVRLQELRRAEATVVEDYILLDPHAPDYVPGRVGGKQAFGAKELFEGGQPQQHGALVVMSMLGFYFEVARHDRDSYIVVNDNNIRPDKLHHYDKLNADATLPLPYDYASATHPSVRFWHVPASAGPSLATITKLDPSGKIMLSLGQHEKLLSDLDIVKINSVYGTKCREKGHGRIM